MGLISKTYTFSAGHSIIATEHNVNYDTLYNAINGNINNANIIANAGITDDKLAQITTASKVHGTSLTGLASIPSGAGAIPAANVTALTITSQATGDLLYYDSSDWTGINVGTAGQVLRSTGTVPEWSSSIVSTIVDYGTSGSAFTVKNSKDLKIAFGTLTVSGASANLTNLPFTSDTSYSITGTFGTNASATEAVTIVQTSGSAATIYSSDDQSQAVHWFAIGI